MTGDRYLEWKSEIAKARAAGDSSKLASLQLDYNLELGECLAHQSQRTKDIKGELVNVRQHIVDIGKAVQLVDDKFVPLESAAVRTADSVSGLAKSVKDLIAYKNGLVVEHEGVKLAGKAVKTIAIVISVVVSWAYAIYQAVISNYGN